VSKTATAPDVGAQKAVRVVEVPPAPRPARMRRRHWMVGLSFVLLVVLPTLGAGAYLYGWAANQYASRVAFTVRTEEAASAVDLLGGLSSLTGGNASSSDTDILYEFIQSQEMVREIDAQLDLGALYRKPENDPVFSLSDDATIEDLVEYWQSMVRLFYDPGTGLIEVEARAFAPQDAQSVARAVLERSSLMINQLSTVARNDMTGYAKEELDAAQEQLREARQALMVFRNETQIVDVGADLQGQMGVLGSLQAQLAEALVEIDLLSETAAGGDPRISQAERRIAAIERRIAQERAKFGGTGVAADGRPYSELVGEFESLQVDLEFAQESYLATRAAYESRIAEARRQNRYLAAYVQPTLPEAALYPQRDILLLLTALIAFGLWAISVLVFYSLKDRR
jgi:capsular polysaccharide transport system permease protein